MHSHKISTPTGTPVPDEKVKELSSNISNYNFAIKSLPGGVPDQALLLAVGVAGNGT